MGQTRIVTRRYAYKANVCDCWDTIRAPGSVVTAHVTTGLSDPNDRHVDTRSLLQIGDPAMELGRLAEFALLPANGLDYEAILAGYERPVPVDSAAFWIYRLDAAVMLALLFNSDPTLAGLGPAAVDRLREVHQRLSQELSK